jgi:hypothetical protein
VDEVRGTLKSFREKALAAPSADHRDAVTALGSGLEAFRKGCYADAASAFRALTKSQPDDACSWYLAGVASGLATNVWTGETEERVNKGVEREKAGTPAIAETDATL